MPAALALLPLFVLLLGVAYGMAGATALRQLGKAAALALWPAATIVLTGVAVFRVRAQQLKLGIPAERQVGWTFALLAFGVAALMFGAGTWAILRRARKSQDPRIGFRDVLAAALACLGGFALALVVLLIMDVAGLAISFT